MCIGCGLCCDGTLFGHVRLEPSDDVHLLGKLQLIPEGGERFIQPCAAFDGRRCSCYPQRPSACRDYRCKLLVKFEAGDVSLEDAKQTVHAMRELVVTARRARERCGKTLLPLVASPDSDISQLDERARADLFDLVVLDAFTRMHFHERGEPRSTDPAE